MVIAAIAITKDKKKRTSPTTIENRRKAAREDKLLFTLHVSGNFEDPGFT